MGLSLIQTLVQESIIDKYNRKIVLTESLHFHLDQHVSQSMIFRKCMSPEDRSDILPHKLMIQH